MRVASPDYLARRGAPQVPANLLVHACLHYRFPNSGKLETSALRRAAGEPELPLPTSSLPRALARQQTSFAQGPGLRRFPVCPGVSARRKPAASRAQVVCAAAKARPRSTPTASADRAHRRHHCHQQTHLEGQGPRHRIQSYVEYVLTPGHEIPGVLAALDGSSELAAVKRQYQHAFIEKCQAILAPFAGPQGMSPVGLWAMVKRSK